MVLIDSHCHLDMLGGHSELELFIEKARQSNVHYMQTICTRLDNFPVILEIAEKFKNVFASVGVHPNEVGNDICTAKELLNLAKHPKVIGLGETGLDYYYGKADHKQLQIENFRQHILASSESGLPVIVHSRDAEDDTTSIISEMTKQKPFPFLIHCFTASKEFAVKILDLGGYISVAGIVTFKNASALQEIVKYIPLDRLLVETDSPYLAPVPMRGKQNEPAFTSYVANYIAELKGITPEEVAAQTTKNFTNLFTKFPAHVIK